MTRLIVSLSPNIHGSDSVERNMYGVLLALVPAFLVSLFYFGIGSLITCVTAVLSCVLFEWLINKYILKNDALTISDGSALVTGILLGFNLPSNIPFWIVIVGSLVAIGIGKMTYGGLGRNLFNPALVGRCFLLVSFPAQMTSWPVEGQWLRYTDAVTGATPLSIMKEAIKSGDASVLEHLPSSLHLLLGNPGINNGGGAIGEVCAVALIAGCVFMIWRKIITWHIPVSVLSTIFVLAGIMHVSNDVYADPISVILSGGIILGATFMATDYVTSPMTRKGQVVYGIGIGVLTIVIRSWSAYPEGMSFAILIMNAFTPLINMYVRPKRFGERKNNNV